MYIIPFVGYQTLYNSMHIYTGTHSILPIQIKTEGLKIGSQDPAFKTKNKLKCEHYVSYDLQGEWVNATTE